MQYERIAVTHPTIPVQAGLAPLVDGQTDVALPVFGTAGGISLPFGGSLLGIAINLSAATGSGALSFDVKIGSTQQGIDTVVGTADTVVTAVFPRGQYVFAAGDVLNITYTSTTLGTNGNATVTLLVVLNEARN